MNLKISLTEELTNTQFAPLAVIFALYQQNNRLEPLKNVLLEMRSRDFTPDRQAEADPDGHSGGLRDPFRDEFPAQE